MSAPEHPSRFALEAHSVGEGTPETRAHVEGCIVCRTILESIEAERRNFIETRSFETWAADLSLRVAEDEPAGPRTDVPPPVDLERWRTVRRQVLAGAVGFAAAAAAVALMIVVPEPSPKVRFKGGPVLEAVRARGDDQTRHQGAVPIAAGDRLRFLVHLDGPARVDLTLEEDGAPPLVLARAQGLSAGLHALPEDALRVEPPVQAAVVELIVEDDDGEVHYATVELVPDD